MFRNIASGNSASSVLCRANSCHLHLVDVGVDADVSDVAPRPDSSFITVTHAKVSEGSRDMSIGPAMTADEVRAAQAVGKEAMIRAVTSRSIDTRCSSVVVCIGEVSLNVSDPSMVWAYSSFGFLLPVQRYSQ